MTAPGVTNEVEAAIDAFNEAVIEFWNEDTSREQFDAARAALLAAIAKYGDERFYAGQARQAFITDGGGP